ncbi:MAG: arylsulfotransferase family protein [Acidobacteriota bacterium]
MSASWKIALLFGVAFVWGVLTYRFIDILGERDVDPETSGRPTERLPDEGKKIHVESETEDLGVLRSLGYVTATFDPNSEQRGVLIHNPEKAFQGVTLYDSVLRGQAFLLDMDGRPVHRWDYDVDPVSHVHVELLDSGDLLVQVYEQGLLKINKDSEVLWYHPDRVHHDLAIGGDGDIYLLTRHEAPYPRFHSETNSLEETVTRLSPDGQVKGKISLLDMLLDSPYSFLLPTVNHLDFGAQEGGLDLMHTNHIEFLQHTGSSLPEVFAEGHFMISMRNISTIAVFDWDEERVLWAWGPTNVSFQHHPTLLENGNVLLFDNGREQSRVIEFNPETFEMHWEFAPGPVFFSKTRGGAQRLPNGNTLVTESDKGYAFEITTEGEVVWRFANPEVNRRQEREILWRMKRFAVDELPFLAEAS